MQDRGTQRSHEKYFWLGGDGMESVGVCGTAIIAERSLICARCAALFSGTRFPAVPNPSPRMDGGKMARELGVVQSSPESGFEALGLRDQDVESLCWLEWHAEKWPRRLTSSTWLRASLKSRHLQGSARIDDDPFLGERRWVDHDVNLGEALSIR